MEGILEKPSKIPGRKTKVWSVLDDATLSFFKENKRSSCIDSIDLSDIVSVAIGTNCQFEIETDRGSNTYRAESTDKCTEWVKRLSRYSKDRTVQNASQDRRDSVMKAKQLSGEHTVEVRTARSIFEEKSKNQNRSTYTCPSPIKENPFPFRKSDPNKAYKTINDARSHLHHVGVKQKLEENSGTLSERNSELTNDSINGEKHKQLGAMSYEINDTRKESKYITQKDGNVLSCNDEKNSCEPESGNEQNSTSNNMGHEESKHVILGGNNNSLHRNKETGISKSRKTAKSEKDCIKENGILPENGCVGNDKMANKRMPSASDEGNDKRNSMHKNTNLQEGTGKTSLDTGSVVDTENRPDSGYSTTVGENGRNSQENKTDLTDFERNRLSKGGKAQTIDLGKGTAEMQAGGESEKDGDDSETIVVMRKSRSCVSVSADDTISIIENSESSEGTFPILRRSRKPSLSDSGRGNIGQSSGYVNSKKSVQDLEDLRESLNDKNSDKLSSYDDTDGYATATPHQEIVENYADIDDLMRKINFPNIPCLPNSLPNGKDLAFVNDLKGAFDDDSSDNLSETSSLSCEDLVLKLGSIIET